MWKVKDEIATVTWKLGCIKQQSPLQNLRRKTKRPLFKGVEKLEKDQWTFVARCGIMKQKTGVEIMSFLEKAEALRTVPQKEPTEKEKNEQMCKEIAEIIKEDILKVARGTPLNGKPLQFKKSAYLGPLNGDSPPFASVIIRKTRSVEKHFFIDNKNYDIYSITPCGNQILNELKDLLAIEKISVLRFSCGIGYADTKINDYGEDCTVDINVGRYRSVPSMVAKFSYAFPLTTTYEYERSVHTFKSLRIIEDFQSKRGCFLKYSYMGLYVDYSVG